MTDGDVKYRILGVLGEGGFGKVYRARLETDAGFSKDVAIKVLHDEEPPKALLRRFRDEARILGLLNDRAIVGVEPPIQLDDRWAVVMAFVDGLPCSGLGADSGIPPGVAIEIISEIARALHNAYNTIGPDGEPLHLLHRDIKPDNIQVTPSGDVMLLDFGIAKANFANREHKTQRGFGGTPGYIAPERLEAIEDHRGDVFSLGVVLHEIVTGTRPRFSPPTMQFTGEAPEYANDDLEISSEITPEQKRVLDLAAWMRSYDLEGRPTARQVEAACRELRRELPPPFLREWAESNVPSRSEMEQDDRTGRLISVTRGPSAKDPSPPPATAPPATNTSTGFAIGALLGGGTVVLLGLGIVMVGVVAIVFLVANALQPAPPPAPQPQPTLVAPQPAPEPATPEPKAEPAPEPKAPRVITLPGASAPRPSPAPSPQPTPAPVAEPPTSAERPTGTVVVRTIPSGATVRERGVALTASGGGYPLSPGMHILTITSPAGESTQIPVQVKVGQQVDICYSFDTNSTCGG